MLSKCIEKRLARLRVRGWEGAKVEDGIEVEVRG